jgi:hypothetical protein
MQKVNNDLKPPRKLVPTLSERVDWVIRRAMSADPALRPAACWEFVTDLIGRKTHKTVTPDLPDTELDVWFVEYLDEHGRQSIAIGATQDLRQLLRDGLLGDVSRVRAGRTKSGPHKPLANLPQFSDLQRGQSPSQASEIRHPLYLQLRDSPASPPTRKESLQWQNWLILLGLALGTALLAGKFLFTLK